MRTLRRWASVSLAWSLRLVGGARARAAHSALRREVDLLTDQVRTLTYRAEQAEAAAESARGQLEIEAAARQAVLASYEAHEALFARATAIAQAVPRREGRR